MTEPKPGDETEIVATVSALLARFPGDDPVAAVDLARDPGGQLMISISPTNPAAAAVVVKVTVEGALQAKVGSSRFDIVTDTRGPLPVDLLAGILEAVFAGRVSEAPGRRGGTLKVDLYDRTQVKVGEVVGSLSGRAWHQFASYGDAPQPEPPPAGPGRMAQVRRRLRRLV